MLETSQTSQHNPFSDRDPPENLTSSEFKARKHLPKDKNIVIQKGDKGKGNLR